MRFTIVYKSLNEMVKKGRYEFHAKVKYNMYPEMLDEFQSSQFPVEFTKKMEEIDTDEDKKNFEYELDIEYPYGTFEATIFFKNKHF